MKVMAGPFNVHLNHEIKRSMQLNSTNYLDQVMGCSLGKTAGGTNVWLDTARTSVFDHYQLWRNRDDGDVQ